MLGDLKVRREGKLCGLQGGYYLSKITGTFCSFLSILHCFTLVSLSLPLCFCTDFPLPDLSRAGYRGIGERIANSSIFDVATRTKRGLRVCTRLLTNPKWKEKSIHIDIDQLFAPRCIPPLLAPLLLTPTDSRQESRVFPALSDYRVTGGCKQCSQHRNRGRRAVDLAGNGILRVSFRDAPRAHSPILTIGNTLPLRLLRLRENSTKTRVEDR